MLPPPAVLPPPGVTMPDLTGVTPRAAARRLHALGVRVRGEGFGRVRRMVPGAGARIEPGDTVSLHGALSFP